MRILFIHHNAPGQFGRLAAALVARGHDVVFVGQQSRQTQPGVRFVAYRPNHVRPVHTLLTDLNRSAENGRQVFGALRSLANDNWIPDLVLGHDGWGEMSFVKDALPQTKVAAYFEYYYRTEGQDVGFDKEFPLSKSDLMRVRTRNITNLVGLDAADARWTPTQWQRSLYPREWQSHLEVIHDGIDTAYMSPRLARSSHVQLPTGERLSPDTPIITFVARNLEPYRGFHIFMRALPRLLTLLPDARVVIVGGDGVSYGRKPRADGSWREHLLKETAVDSQRVLFLGRVNYASLRALFQATSAHVYLTYPFVLSWSLLEAMACGAQVVASRTPPVTEVIADNENGLLFDFFDVSGLVDRVVEAVRRDAAAERRGWSARETIIARYDFANVCLPAQLKFINETTGIAV